MDVVFVITAHAPYLRRAGRSPLGEEALHETTALSLVPLLNLLGDLSKSHLAPRIGLAISPLLLDQLADPVVQKHFVFWIEHWIARHEDGLARSEQAGDERGAYLARFYVEWGHGIWRSFTERYDRNLVTAMRMLCAAGIAEPLAGAASYAYLPLLKREESVRAQIEQGSLIISHYLGKPQGLWLPGCGWRPGIAEITAAAGLRYLIADPSSLPAAGRPAARLLSSRVAALFYDEATSDYIWSPELGYSGDPSYQEAEEGRPGRSSHNPAIPYDPYHAFRRAQEHASHFVAILVALARQRDPADLALIPLDTWLLGQHWFEGPTWFQTVLTLTATHPALTLNTPWGHLRAHRPRHQATLRPGSWGAGGDHRIWDGESATSYWDALHRAEERMVDLANGNPYADGERERLLSQIARELLLAQSSDWPMMLTAVPGEPVATRSWQTYLQRFHQLADLAAHPALTPEGRALLDRLEETDGPFPFLNYRMFRSQ